ncbi:MAG: Gfo/Idh/MocA family oxidoreductase [Armatimonadota bacterium]
MNGKQESSRRRFLRHTARAVVAGAAVGSMPNLAAMTRVPGPRTFKVALVGCGNRGNGALRDHLEAAKYLNEKLGWNLEIQVVATADWFVDKARAAGNRHGVGEELCFGGADAYRKAIEAGPDIVLMGQPPAFRPPHFEAAIEAGKHVFFEKPSAVDPPGVRRVIQAGEQATEQGLSVVAGTQRRHQENYNRRALEIKDGARGRIVGGRVAWNMGHIFGKQPINPQGPDDLCRNWHVWVETSGDHICEQHVHNIDIANWFLGAHPISAGGFGGRARRPGGNMYDFFSVDFEYPGGIHIHSMCRQIAGCWNWVGEDLEFERDKPGDFQIQSPDPYADVGYHKSGYVSEHAHLLHAIVNDKPINEARQVAESTGTAIMGRESAYTGKRITWEEMYENPDEDPEMYNLTLKPAADDFETGEVVIPEEGEVRIPGVAAK